MELIKTTIKVGNSAGVLLPKKYLNSQVKIILEPLNIEKDVLDILIEENLLSETIGVYVTGSYARGEQTIESDIDILVITNKTEKRIKKERYDLLLITEVSLERQLSENILPILPMIKEAKAIINKDLIKDYINSPLTKKNLKWHINTTKSMMENINGDLEIYKKINEKYMSDNLAYILILRLRTLYIIDCIRKNKISSKKDFLKIVKEITGSLKSYDGYVRSKNNQKTNKELPLNQAEELVSYINKKVAYIEKWLKEKKD